VQHSEDPQFRLVYPVISIYAAVYPHVEPYPEVLQEILSPFQISVVKFTQDFYDTKGHSHYYPFIAPYPSHIPGQDTNRPLSDVSAESNYSYDLRGHRHGYPRLDPYPRYNRSGSNRRTHTDLHDDVFGAGYWITPSTMVLRSQRGYNSELAKGEYPVVEPYPAIGTRSERIKRLALALNEENTTWNNYMSELLKDSPPIQTFPAEYP